MPTTVSLSQRFEQLKSRIQQLKDNLLPPFDPTGSYSPVQQDCTMAFRLLVHSEIEAFLEDRSKVILRNALNRWKQEQSASTVLLCLLAFTDKNWGGPPESVQNVQGELPLVSERLNIASRIYFSKLGANHGIKEKNILQILLPIGIRYDQIDTTWLNSLNSYGEKRGEIAHQSIMALSSIDPKDEWATVNDVLLPGLEQVDQLLSSLE